MRGLTRSVIALIVPPLPAPSRPSNTTQIFAPGMDGPFLDLHELDVQTREFFIVLFPAQALGWARAFAGASRVVDGLLSSLF